MTITKRNQTLADLKPLVQQIVKNLGKKTAVIGLIGPLGSGKTATVKLLAKQLNIKQTKSPSFTIINQAQGLGRKFYHLDLYRLNSFRELEDLGFSELLSAPQSLIVIEWADKFRELNQVLDYVINFSFGDKPNTRHVTIKYKT